MNSEVQNCRLLLEGNDVGGQFDQEKSRPAEEIKIACEMNIKVEALNLTLKRQFSGDLNEISAALLHQVITSNNDPQILAQWATKMINNITLFNTEVSDGLSLNWLGEAGVGPAYTSRAFGPRKDDPKETVGSWKRSAIPSEPISNKKNTLLLTEQGTLGELTETHDNIEETPISLASEEDFISPVRNFSLGTGERDSNGSQTQSYKRRWKNEGRRISGRKSGHSNSRAIRSRCFEKRQTSIEVQDFPTAEEAGRLNPPPSPLIIMS